MFVQVPTIGEDEVNVVEVVDVVGVVDIVAGSLSSSSPHDDKPTVNIMHISMLKRSVVVFFTICVLVEHNVTVYSHNGTPLHYRIFHCPHNGENTDTRKRESLYLLPDPSP